jgi:hypothetical protein
VLHSLITSLLRALLRWIDPQPAEKRPQQVTEDISWKPLPKKGIVVVDYTDCPSPQELNAIENELKELVDSLDLDECGEPSSPSALN